MDDYSQHGEQAVILSNCGEPGIFLDIGANDGVTFSNTRALVDLGWSGVHVEPGIAAFSKLKENLPDSMAYRIAISDQDGEALFHESDKASRHMLSSLVDAEKERWGASYGFGTITVKTMTVQTFLEHADLSHIDFLSIDAEGADLMIFLQFDLSGLGVRLCCVEHNGRSLADFDAHAASHGMRRICHNVANAFYAKV